MTRGLVPAVLLPVVLALACGSAERADGSGGNDGSITSSGSAGSGGEGGVTVRACEDHTVPQGRTPCRDDADCSGPDIACFLPSSPPPLVCGDGCSSARLCASNEDCAEGGICVEFEDPCCAALGDDAAGTYCIQRCNESSCEDGVCADDGRCVEVPCAPGSCGPNQACNTETGRCEFRQCGSDEDCDCGFCADVCQNGPGYCDFVSGG